MSIDVSFGIYFKLCQLKEIKQFTSTVIKDKSVKKEYSWWKFKEIINKFIQERKEVVIASHMLVFNKSMGVFVPK